MTKLYYPKEILDSKFEHNKCFFLVQWVGYKNPTWEPEEYISHRVDLIQAHRDLRLIEQLRMRNSGYIYCRVSSKEQAKYTEGHTSLDVQEREIREFCVTNDIHVVTVVREVYSARNMCKLRGLQYLCDITTSGQSIYVYDISRFSRNVHHALNLLEELNDRNISVVSTTEDITYQSAAGRNQFRLQLCASNYYSDICSQKVKASITFRRARGDYIGRAPYGFTTTRDVQTHIRLKIPEESEMRIIENLRGKKEEVHEDIRAALVVEGVKFRGRDPTLSNIRRIMRRFHTDLKPSRMTLRRRRVRE